MTATLQSLLSALTNLFRWWVTIAPWEQGLRVRLGKRVTLLQAGVHLRIPVFDKMYVQTVRRRFSSVPTQTLTMDDGKTVTIAGSLGYTIVDLERLYSTLQHAEATLEAEAQGVISDFIMTHDYSDFTAVALQQHVDAALDFERYGIGQPQFIITTFVCTRTYRLLMGEPRDYTTGAVLNTIDEAGKGDEY